MIVTPENWYWGPGNRWAWRNMRRIFPTARISRGSGPVAPLPSRFRAVDHLEFHDPVSGVALKVGQVFERHWVDGFLVLQDGAIVTERYFNGMRPDELHLLMSVSKSVVGSLAGLLVEAGTIDPAEQVTDYLPELAETAYAGATLRHLLDMAVGMEFDYDSFSTASDIYRMDESVGWVPRVPAGRNGSDGIKDFLGTLTRSKGEHGRAFDYQSQHTSALAWVLERTTGRDLADLVQSMIWEKLGAEHDAALVLDHRQTAYAPAGFNMSLRDLGRFADMILHDGLYNGQRIIPEEWLADIRSAVSAEAWALAEKTPARDSLAGFGQGSYRSYWYLGDPAGGRMMGLGLGNQMILIDPPSGVVAVVFSSPPTAADGELGRVTIYHAIDAIIRSLAR
jgi:CubicO group peptidase (beta-lactamase class C family)